MGEPELPAKPGKELLRPVRTRRQRQEPGVAGLGTLGLEDSWGRPQEAERE